MTSPQKICKLAITVDVEWVPRDIIVEMMDLFEKHHVPVTWFCTDHPELPHRNAHEYALHPHFKGMNDWEERLSELRRLHPDARGVRSHCLHSDTRLVRLLTREGFLYQSNLFVPGQNVVPFQRETGLWEVPIHYMDFVHLCNPDQYPKGYSTESLPRFSPLVVLDFHPIPWWINAANLQDYEAARPDYHDPAALTKRRRSGLGVRTLLDSLLAEIQQGSWEPVRIQDFILNGMRS